MLRWVPCRKLKQKVRHSQHHNVRLAMSGCVGSAPSPIQILLTGQKRISDPHSFKKLIPSAQILQCKWVGIRRRTEHMILHSGYNPFLPPKYACTASYDSISWYEISRCFSGFMFYCLGSRTQGEHLKPHLPVRAHCSTAQDLDREAVRLGYWLCLRVLPP